MPIELSVSPRESRKAQAGGADAVIGFAMLTLCAAIIAGLSWTRPTAVASTVSYTQSGKLSYSARTKAGSAYGSVGVVTGDPVYGSVVSALTLSYSYRMRAAATSELTGTEQLVATIGNGNGLNRTLPVQPVADTFHDGQFSATGTLQLSALAGMVASFEKASGGLGAQSYPVSVSPSVSIRGRVAGEPLSASFSSPIDFTFSGGNLLPRGLSGGGQASFAASSKGSVTVPHGKQAVLLFGISVSSARIGSLAVLIVALLLGGLAGWPLLRKAASEDERDRIAVRYGSMIVEAEAVAPHLGVTIVQLASFEDVVRVARRLECPILHWRDVGDVYAVVDSGTLYRYRAGVSWAEEFMAARGANGTTGDHHEVLAGHPSTPPTRS